MCYTLSWHEYINCETMENLTALAIISLGVFLAIVSASAFRYAISQTEKRLIVEQQERIHDLQVVQDNLQRRVDDLEREKRVLVGKTHELEHDKRALSDKFDRCNERYIKAVRRNMSGQPDLSDTDKQPIIIVGVNVAKLRTVLTSRFSDEELRELAFDLDVPIPQNGTVRTKALYLLTEIENHKRLGELVEWLKIHRTDIEEKDY